MFIKAKVFIFGFVLFVVVCNSSFASGSSVIEGCEVLLSFDDGPVPLVTNVILDVLRENKIQAIFFIIGYKANRNPSVVRRIVTEGHIVGSHGYSHKVIYAMDSAQAKQDFLDSINVLNSIALSVDPLWPGVKYFRAPHYKYTQYLLDVVHSHGLVVVNSDFSPKDWRDDGDEIILSRFKKGLATIKSKVVIGLHDNKFVTARLLQSFIDELKGHGCVFTGSSLING